MTRTMARFLTKYCRLLTVVTLLSMLIPLCFLPKARVSNSVEMWQAGNQQEAISQSSRQLSRPRMTGGPMAGARMSGQFIIVATKWSDPLTDQALDQQVALADQLRKIPSVQSVFDFGTIARSIQTAMASPATKLLQLFSSNTEEDTDWRGFIRSEPLFRNLLIGQDGQTVGMFISLQMFMPGREAIDQIRQIIAESGISPDRVYLTGMPVISSELNRYSKIAIMIFLPLAIVIGAIVLILMVRNFVCCLAISITLVSSMLWTIGLLFLTGHSMNMITAMLPGLLISLALAGNIHLVSHYLALLASGMDKQAALEKTIQTMLLPVFMTSLTTAVGFASVMISPLGPIRDFGEFAAIGIMISCLLNFILLPGLLSFNRKQPCRAYYSKRHWTEKFVVCLPFSRPILIVSVLILAVSIPLTFRLQANSDIISFLPGNSKVTHDINSITDNLTGLFTLNVEVKPNQDTDPARLNAALDSAIAKLEQDPLISKAVYSGQVRRLAEKLGPIALAALALNTGQNSLIGNFQNMSSAQVDPDRIQLMIFTRACDSQQLAQVTNTIDTEMKALEPLANYSLRGFMPGDSQIDSLVQTQVYSYLAALAVILFLIGLIMRSVRAALAAILPNALPIITMFAFMAITGIPLNMATVLIAGIATGIAVDDTIHLLACYRSLRPLYDNDRDTFLAAFDQVGRSITWTSIIAASGFAILIFSPFKPLQYFGLLSSLTMITAWLADVVITPACITSMKLWQKDSRP